MTDLAEQDAGPLATWSFPATGPSRVAGGLTVNTPASYAMKDVGPCLHGPRPALLRY
jgi:hypothetical protein